jgi:putative transposase
LNEEVFGSMAEARAMVETWRRDFNTARPHSAHGGLTPTEARNRAAADRLRSAAVSADRPLPTAKRTGYATQGLSE